MAKIMISDYQTIKDSSHTSVHLHIIGKLDKNCNVVDYANKYVELWDNNTERSKLEFTLKMCGDEKFDQLIDLLQNSTQRQTERSPFFDHYQLADNIKANDWDKDFEPLMIYQNLKLSSLRR